MRKIVKAGAVVLAVLVAVAWIAGEAMIRRANPPGRYAGVILSVAADPLLKRACFDCHSNETRYPAYAYLPIASLLLANNVREGRGELNFSEWNLAGKEDQADSIEESLEAIRGGSMPPWDYRLLHPQARLTAAEIAVIEKAAAQAYGFVPGKGGNKKEKEGREKERGEREKREKH
jgi:hypothetical protein